MSVVPPPQEMFFETAGTENGPDKKQSQTFDLARLHLMYGYTLFLTCPPCVAFGI